MLSNLLKTISRLSRKAREPHPPLKARLPGQENLLPENLDTASDTWIFIDNWSERRIQETRVQNDRHLTPTETAKLRGIIEAFKELRELPATLVSANTQMVFRRFN